MSAKYTFPFTPDTDRAIIEGITEGNEKAFSMLFYKFLPKLYPYVLRFSKSQEGAQEIIQETFIRIWLYRDKIGDIENLSSWLFKLASNECYSYLRKKVLTDKFSNPILAEPAPSEMVQEWHDGKDLKRLVAEAVQLLPAQRQKIYRMSRDQHKTIPQIAAELDISINTVKNTLVVSLKSIREYLEKAGVHWLLILIYGQDIFF